MMSPAVSSVLTIHPGVLQHSWDTWQKKAKIDHVIERISKSDASVWTSDQSTQRLIADRLGWLGIASAMRDKVGDLTRFADSVTQDGIGDIVTMGMGGSSLCPTVLGRMFPRPGSPQRYMVLDSTDPAAIQKIESRIDLKRTLFISASKSGKTVETLSHTEYFWHKMVAELGSEAGRHFAAITDAGSQLEQLARARQFRRIFLNPSDIGGRYSALSYFGLVPGALAGIPLQAILDYAVAGEHEGLSGSPANPALELGLLMGAGARAGQDKLTFVATPSLAPMIPWIEQLIAESTGKNQTGIVPIEGEPPGDLDDYGPDRLFVLMRLVEERVSLGRLKDQLVAAGRPVVEVTLVDRAQIGTEFFRWELATAVAGWVLGINPFDEPNVQESKDNTRMLLDQIGTKNRAPLPEAVAEGVSFSIRRGGSVAAGQTSSTVKASIRPWVERAQDCGYIAVLAYLDDAMEIEVAISRIRKTLRAQTKRATLRGYGPRYLHSIGQLYKGGPQSGAFMLITAENTADITIPGAAYTFGTLKMAQALGDARSLTSRGRPFLHVHLGADALRGLNELALAIESE